jgi:hypothetical protein
MDRSFGLCAQSLSLLPLPIPSPTAAPGQPAPHRERRPVLPGPRHVHAGDGGAAIWPRAGRLVPLLQGLRPPRGHLCRAGLRRLGGRRRRRSPRGAGARAQGGLHQRHGGRGIGQWQRQRQRGAGRQPAGPVLCQAVVQHCRRRLPFPDPHPALLVCVYVCMCVCLFVCLYVTHTYIHTHLTTTTTTTITTTTTTTTTPTTTTTTTTTTTGLW